MTISPDFLSDLFIFKEYPEFVNSKKNILLVKNSKSALLYFFKTKYNSSKIDTLGNNMIDFTHISSKTDLEHFFSIHNINPSSYTDTVHDTYVDIAGQALIDNNTTIIKLINNSYPHIFPDYIQEIKENYAHDYDIKVNLVISSFNIENSTLGFQAFYNFSKSLIDLYQNDNSNQEYKDKIYIALSQRLNDGFNFNRDNNYDFEHLSNLLSLLEKKFPDKNNSQEFTLPDFFSNEVFTYIKSQKQIKHLSNIFEKMNADFFSNDVLYYGIARSPHYFDFFIETKGVAKISNISSDHYCHLNRKEMRLFNNGAQSIIEGLFEKDLSINQNDITTSHYLSILQVYEKHNLFSLLSEDIKKSPTNIINTPAFFKDDYYSVFKSISSKNNLIFSEHSLNTFIHRTNKEQLSNIIDHCLSNSHYFSEDIFIKINLYCAKQYDLTFYTHFLDQVLSPDIFLQDFISKVVNTTNPELKPEQEEFISAITKQNFLDKFSANLDSIVYSTGKSSVIVQKNAIENKLPKITDMPGSINSSKKRL